MKKTDAELLQGASDVALLAYNPDQPRDDYGRFGSNGAGTKAENASTASQHYAAREYHKRMAKELESKNPLAAGAHRNAAEKHNRAYYDYRHGSAAQQASKTAHDVEGRPHP